jgi:integrase
VRGHVYKRGATWTVMFDEGRDGRGKRLQRSRGGFPTRRDAQRFLTDTLARLGDGCYAAPSKQTLGDFLTAEWLPAIADTVRPLTIAQYTSIVKVRIVPRIGHLRLQGLNAAHLNALYRELAIDGLGPGSVRATHSVLRRAFRDGVRWGRLARNPAGAADPPAATESRATAWTAGEVRRFLEHVDGDRLFALWRLAATTGMRRGELAGLAWLALDLEGARLTVDQQLLPTVGGVSFGPPKSSRSRRTIALDPDTVAALREHREAQLLERAFAGDAYVDHDLVFANPLGAPLGPHAVSAAFLKHRGAAGLTGTLHILRHTHATLALTHGIPVHVVAARLGDRPETLLKTYAHLLPASDGEAAVRVASLLAG